MSEAAVPSAKAFTLSPSQGECFTIIGGGVRILADGASTGGALVTFEAPIPPGEGPPLHRHEREDELFYVIEGRFKFVIDGTEFIAETGAFAYAGKGTAHSFRNIGTATGKLLVTCTPAGIEVPFRAIQDPAPGSSRPPITPADVVAALGAHGITFVGPPL